MATRRRLDAELVRRGLTPSREQARAAIEEGRVLVAGTLATKPGRLVHPGEPVVLSGPPPRYVGRGGRKLEAALAGFGIDPAGERVIDVGASTGGFSDCLLQHGAARVVAVDVGRGQLHPRLRQDPRIEVYERTNIRDLDPSRIGGPAPLVVADLSFISLRTVLDELLALVSPGGRLLALVKPQFEAGRVEASRHRGVITDPDVWHRVLQELDRELTGRGAAMMGIMVSPITGADGNVEFFALVAPAGTDVARSAGPAALAAAVSEAAARQRGGT